jgi:hypothetical protein
MLHELTRLHLPVASCTKGTATLLRANMLLRARVCHTTADRRSQGQASQGPIAPKSGEFSINSINAMCPGALGT